MKSGKVKCNLKGVGLGDSWISPMDFVNSWGPYLYTFVSQSPPSFFLPPMTAASQSYLSDAGLQTFNALAGKCQGLVDSGQWTAASTCWDEAEVLVGTVPSPNDLEGQSPEQCGWDVELTDEVSWYNVLKRGDSDPLSGTPFLSLQAGRRLSPIGPLRAPVLSPVLGRLQSGWRGATSRAPSGAPCRSS